MATTPKQLSLEDIVVVDTDSHVIETIDDIIPYIDDEYEAVKDLIGSTAHPELTIYSGSTVLPPFPDSYQVQLDESYEPADKEAENSEFGIDYSVVQPSLNTTINNVDNAQCQAALANAYNSWLIDTFLDHSDTFNGLICVPAQKPELAAEEIDKFASEDQMVGVQFHSLGQVPPPGSRKYDPLYEAAEKHGLPIVMHGVNLGWERVFPIQRMWAETFAEDHALSHPFGHQWNLTNMIFQGVPERFPDLEFVFQEAGIAWLPYWMWRLDDHYLELSHELPEIDKMPTDYIREQYYVSTQPLGHTAEHPKHLAQIIDMIGPETIMYSADLPHGDFDPPEELFDRVKTHFEEEEVRAMMGQNAIDVFGL